MSNYSDPVPLSIRGESAPSDLQAAFGAAAAAAGAGGGTRSFYQNEGYEDDSGYNAFGDGDESSSYGRVAEAGGAEAARTPRDSTSTPSSYPAMVG